MRYQTIVAPADDADALAQAAALIRAGELVGFPTETVYGLGANALDGRAVSKIFAAKGRPADNPLIVHIAAASQVDALCRAISDKARCLMRLFWPGPLTLVLPKADSIPDAVSAGLDTVGVRMPALEAARALIEQAGVPIAAPSANLSGRPSPTDAATVYADMQGRIPMILDGGPCSVGVESTVLDMTKRIPVILRPGGVTREMLQRAVGDVSVHKAVLAPLAHLKAASPGMKYTHYAPQAEVIVVSGQPEAVEAHIKRRYDALAGVGKRVLIFCTSETAPAYAGYEAHVWGTRAQLESVARHLFSALRHADALGADVVLCEATDVADMGLAVMNRLLRAAGFHQETADTI
nr:L-threonylcarbamoyladenylate synthase [Maliibacterium massiliense]